jgi:ATP-dependent DNA helicase MPH1
MTPQTLDFDLQDGISDSSKIVLLVVDEAHRASGNYAFCNVIQMLSAKKNGFRVLSLSATPVSKIANL